MIKIQLEEVGCRVVAMLDCGAIGSVNLRSNSVPMYKTNTEFRAFMNVCALEALQLFVTNEINKQIFINEEILNETA